MNVRKEFVLWGKTHSIAIPIINVIILIMNCAYQITSPAQISTDLVKKH